MRRRPPARLVDAEIKFIRSRAQMEIALTPYHVTSKMQFRSVSNRNLTFGCGKVFFFFPKKVPTLKVTIHKLLLFIER